MNQTNKHERLPYQSSKISNLLVSVNHRCDLIVKDLCRPPSHQIDNSRNPNLSLSDQLVVKTKNVPENHRVKGVDILPRLRSVLENVLFTYTYRPRV